MTKTRAKIRHASMELHVKTRSGLSLVVASLIPGAGYVVNVKLDGLDRIVPMMWTSVWMDHARTMGSARTLQEHSNASVQQHMRVTCAKQSVSIETKIWKFPLKNPLYHQNPSTTRDSLFLPQDHTAQKFLKSQTIKVIRELLTTEITQVNQDPIGITKSHQSRSDKAVGLKYMTMTITYKEMTGVPKHGIRTKLR